LRRSLVEEEPPSWEQNLAVGLLRVALLAAGAASGQLIAGILMSTQGAAFEFVKTMFAEGVTQGVAAGAAAFSSQSMKEVAHHFIDSYQAGIRATQHANQTKFLLQAHSQIKTVEDATRLRDACDHDAMEIAAKHYYTSTRDAWVSLLAQSRFGSAGRGRAATTNVMTQSMRDRTNDAAPGTVPATAPGLGHALHGAADGVLAVLADLPDIEGEHMKGAPQVTLAVLNAVPAAIRDQYEGVPLATGRIPRHITARVKGDMPDFSVTVDETGNGPSMPVASAAWLRARARVAHPQTDDADYPTRKDEGLGLLLKDLVPVSIRGDLWKR
jgi:hypothetical protein